MNIEQPSASTQTPTNTPEAQFNDGPKIGFLESFYGILFCPKKIFDDLHSEDSFTILVYGILAVILANLGKLGPGQISLLNIVGIQFIGLISWFCLALFITFLSLVFNNSNNNFARLLGFTGLANAPFLLLTPIALIGVQSILVYKIFSLIMFGWTFTLFFIAVSKSLKLEPWRVLLLALVPFAIGLTGNILSLML